MNIKKYGQCSSKEVIAELFVGFEDTIAIHKTMKNRLAKKQTTIKPIPVYLTHSPGDLAPVGALLGLCAVCSTGWRMDTKQVLKGTVCKLCWNQSWCNQSHVFWHTPA